MSQPSKPPARVFFAWTPLNSLIAAAAVRAVPGGHSVLVWLGAPKNPWFEKVRTMPGWDKIVDLSLWGLLGFREYLLRYRQLSESINNLLSALLVEYDIREVGVNSADEYVSLLFIKLWGKRGGFDPWPKVSMFEDGLGLYFRSRPPRVGQYLLKLSSGLLLRRNVLPLTLGHFAANPSVRKIYATIPEALPLNHGKEVSDIHIQFLEIAMEHSIRLKSHRNLPPGSALILSSNLSPQVMSAAEEIRLIEEMIGYCNSKKVNNIYVKLHHYDAPDKIDLFKRYGVQIIDFFGIPYEVVHPKLRPDYLLSVASSSLYLCSFFPHPCQIVAFCNSINEFPQIPDFFSSRGIITR